MKHIVAALLVGLAVAADRTASSAQSNGEPPRTAAEVIEAAGFAPDDVGYLLVDLRDERVLAEHNADKPFLPASVAKIPAIAASLAILGGDHRFATTLHAEGDVRDGVLIGSITLRGGGDPFLSSDDLQALAKDLAASGISAVDGQVPLRCDRTDRSAPNQCDAAGGGRLQHRRQRTFGELQPRAP